LVIGSGAGSGCGLLGLFFFGIVSPRLTGNQEHCEPRGLLW
jgi:hypothetical protein